MKNLLYICLSLLVISCNSKIEYPYSLVFSDIVNVGEPQFYLSDGTEVTNVSSSLSNNAYFSDNLKDDVPIKVTLKSETEISAAHDETSLFSLAFNGLMEEATYTYDDGLYTIVVPPNTDFEGTTFTAEGSEEEINIKFNAYVSELNLFGNFNSYREFYTLEDVLPNLFEGDTLAVLPYEVRLVIE